MKRLFSILSIICFLKMVSYSQEINIIPKPSNTEIQQGRFELTSNTDIVSARGSKLHNYLQAQIQELIGMKLSVVKSTRKSTSAIKLTLNSKSKIGKEGYEIIITQNCCEIISKTENGLFYGIQSLLQLIPSTPVTQCYIPCLKIKDAPRFTYRGMHLDVSRHFFPKSFIFKYLDLLAMHKMNVFHWHLVDDQGWRIEVKKYPKLTEIGAWRPDDTDKPWNYFVYATADKTKKLYGGYYTQSDIREIVKYATERQITIIPEIEMPGHCAAVIEAYPELSCSGKTWRKDETLVWEFSDPLCIGNEQTFEFLENVLTEMFSLFPSKYIHIGGDECKKSTWLACQKCQTRMKVENLKHEDELQSYLNKRIGKFLASKNRELIGWDEILDGGIAPEATVMSWRGMEGGIKAAQLGHRVIMSPESYCYFNFPQTEDSIKQDKYITLEKVYSFDPVPEKLTKKETNYIIGAQANVWTEYMINEGQIEQMILPRMTALSEVLWSDKKNLNFDDFAKRLGFFFPRLKVLNYNYFTPKQEK